MLDGWRLALGTFTALRVGAPRVVDRRSARWAVLLAPLAALPLGVLVALVLRAGHHLGLGPWPVGVAAVGVLALGSRGLHLDGLSDTADGLAASYDPARSLQVMRSGTAGPAGVVAVVVVLGVQAGALATLLPGRGPWLAAGLVCLSRAVAALGCVRGVPAARPDGLAVTFAGSVPRWCAIALWTTLIVLAWPLFAWAGLPGWHGPAALLAALAAVGALLTRCVHRLGGITGDVLGAIIEVALATLLLSAS